jgi:anti-sigma B factor antagonist
MDIVEQARSTYTILTVHGDFLCEDEKPNLRDTILRMLSGGIKYIIMDLSQVRYMNSCGLGSLVSSMTTLRKAGGDLVLLSPTENVNSLFSMTKLNCIFAIYPTLEQAVTNFH